MKIEILGKSSYKLMNMKIDQGKVWKNMNRKEKFKNKWID